MRAAALQEANYLAYRNEGARLLTTLAAINHDHEVRTAERNTLCCNAVRRGAIATTETAAHAARCMLRVACCKSVVCAHCNVAMV